MLRGVAAQRAVSLVRDAIEAAGLAPVGRHRRRALVGGGAAGEGEAAAGGDGDEHAARGARAFAARVGGADARAELGVSASTARSSRR